MIFNTINGVYITSKDIEAIYSSRDYCFKDKFNYYVKFSKDDIIQITKAEFEKLLDSWPEEVCVCGVRLLYHQSLQETCKELQKCKNTIQTLLLEIDCLK